MSVRVLSFLLAVLFVCGSAGCGSSPQKGAEKDKDMPKPAEREQ